MYVCVTWVYVCAPCVCRCLWRPAEGIGSYATGVTGSFEPPSMLESKPGSSAKTVSALNCCTNSPAQKIGFNTKYRLYNLAQVKTTSVKVTPSG